MQIKNFLAEKGMNSLVNSVLAGSDLKGDF